MRRDLDLTRNAPADHSGDDGLCGAGDGVGHESGLSGKLRLHERQIRPLAEEQSLKVDAERRVVEALLREGTIGADQMTVVVLTGFGLKAAERIGELLGISTE